MRAYFDIFFKTGNTENFEVSELFYGTKFEIGQLVLAFYSGAFSYSGWYLIFFIFYIILQRDDVFFMRILFYWFFLRRYQASLKVSCDLFIISGIIWIMWQKSWKIHIGLDFFEIWMNLIIIPQLIRHHSLRYDRKSKQKMK